MTLISEVDLDGVVINGVRINRGEVLQAYERNLGSPSRSEMPGTPPPYGRRNNVLHFYDDLGLFLREHHATCLIDGIDFLFEPDKCHFPTASHYSGSLRVFGVEVRRGMLFAEFAARCEVSFTKHLGHAWFTDGERVSIQFEACTSKGKRPAQRDVMSALSVGFLGAGRPESAPLRGGACG